jgi:hypothetical protein
MSQWISSFRSEIAKHLDAPDEFISAVGLFVVGASLANKVYIRSPKELTTNLYVLLTGKPGWLRKSTTVNVGVEVLKMVTPSGEFIASNPSSESLAKAIKLEMNGSSFGHGIMIYDELKNFLVQIRKPFAENVGTFMVERFERGTDLKFSRMKDKDSVECDFIPGGFILSFIASTTTPWLIENIRPSDIGGGMLSRFLMVEANAKTRSEADPPPLEDSTLAGFATALKNVQCWYKNRTEFRFHPDGRAAFATIYHDIEKNAMSHGHPEFPSMISRAPVYIKKLALINAAMEMRGDGMIYDDDVGIAWSTVSKSIKACEVLIDEAVAGDGPYGKMLFRVKKILSSKGRIPKRDLMRVMHIKVRELEEILDSFMEQGHAKIEKDGKAEVVVWVE